VGKVNLYRLRLQPHGATLSPWQADTIFGHLCWEAFFQGGEQGLKDFLAPFRAGTPPFVLSDGFPDDMLPRPFLPPPTFVDASKSTRVQVLTDAKKGKGVTLLTQSQFEQVLRGERVIFTEEATSKLKATPRLVLKNQINRLTNTTAGADEDEASGNLYAVEEKRVFREVGEKKEPVSITIYLWAANDEKAKEAENWFRLLARGGYGKKKSVGYGHFDLLGYEPFSINVPDDANAVVALAHFVPAAKDPRDGFYKTRVKYGKLGEAAILKGNALSPFKKPLVMLSAGSTFYSDKPRNYLGRLVGSIHREDSTIVQGAFAPVVPIKLPPREK